MDILGIRIDNFSKSEVLNKVSEFLDSNIQHKIFTPNPEMLVDAQKDKYFRDVLNSGDLNVCDGFGIKIASYLSPSYQEGEARRAGGVADVYENSGKLLRPSASLGTPPLGKRRTVTRYPGVELMLDICKLAEEKNKSIYLLGSGSTDTVKKTAEELNIKFPKLKIIGSNPGPTITYHVSHITYQNEEVNDEIVHDIIMSAPDILFVAFGHNKQEKWIAENLKDLPSVKIAMGVGGAFDYISGRVKRAPLFLQKIGLEWMYRVIREPRRLKRIFKATILFLCLLIKEKNI